jgi:hypothetical protein
MVGGKAKVPTLTAQATCAMRRQLTESTRQRYGRACEKKTGRAQVGGDGQRAGPQVGQRVGPQVARVLGDGNEAVSVYAGERVPGQNFDCYAVRYGHTSAASS